MNPQRRLGLYALLNLLQDVSWSHAFALSLGRGADVANQVAWVLGRQRVVMRTWPAWGEVVEIETWLRPPGRSTIKRDSVIWINGEQVGEATTVLLALDMKTRKTVRTAALAPHVPFHTDARAALEAAKIEPQSGLVDLARFDVRNSDLDMNQHVNNTRYAQWISDSIPIDWHRLFALLEYEINFLAETHLGDAITIQKGMAKPVIPDAAQAQFQGLRAADQRVVFTARITVGTDPDRHSSEPRSAAANSTKSRLHLELADFLSFRPVQGRGLAWRQTPALSASIAST